MKSIYILTLALLHSVIVNAQNLLTNGNFEDYTTCPTSASQVDHATDWQNYTLATPDYFHSCTSDPNISTPTNFGGYQVPASGQGYVGGFAFTSPTDPVSWKELIMTDGFPALTIGNVYEISMSISLANFSSYACDDMGVIFNVNGPTTYPLVESSPPRTPLVDFKSYGAITDTQNWVRVRKAFVADSAYTSLAIGCFSSPIAMTSIVATGAPYSDCYYYIDSVVLRAAGHISIDYTTDDLCAGQEITVPYTFNGTPVFSSGNVFSVQLSNATGSFATPTTIGSLTSTSAGSITAVIPTSTAAGSGYRIRVVSNSIVDSSLPNDVNIRITPAHTMTASSNTPLCEGDTLFLNSTASVTGVSYLWNGPNSFSNINQNNYITPTSASQSGKYAITITRNACITTDTLTVVIKPTPSISTSSNTPVCPATTMQLNATSSLGGSSFNWTGPNSFASSLQNPTRSSVTYADQGTYTVAVTKDGCTAEANVSVAVYITTATPVAGIISNPVCESFPLNLTALSATPGVTYNWTGPSGFTSSVQNPVNATLLSYNNGNFIVTATVNGCMSLPDTVNVQVLPKPYLGSYASPNDTVCEGTVVTFVTVPMSGIVNPSFQWIKNNIPVPGATNLTLIAPYATGDTFYCRTFCQNQCGDNLTLYSNKVGMTVMPIVNNLSVTLSSIPTQPLPGNPVTFNAIVINGGYNPKYQWKKNSSDIFGATYAGYSANNLAPYDEITCCVISSDPCANPITACSDAMVVNFPTSVGEVGNDDIFQLYPNPNDGSFKVKMQNVKCKSIEVMNVSGQVVYELKPNAPQVEYIINLPQQLPPGVYMLRAYSDSNMYRKSFTLSK